MREGRKRSKTRTVSTEEFESHCLEIIDLVEEKGYTYIITKDGRSFVMMRPVTVGPAALAGED
jgi:hypothetical protein